jgi:hypothetical protein
MLERIGRHIRGNIVGYLALFVALSGTALASGVLNKQEKKQVGNIAANKVNQLAPGLSVAKAGDATNATTADNALALGGRASSGYVRNDCAGFGQVKGFAHVIGSASFSSTFVTVFGLNCSGQTVEARRVGTGEYIVRFNGTTATIAVAGLLGPQGGPSPGNTVAEATQTAPGEFDVLLQHSTDGALTDVPFVVILV